MKPLSAKNAFFEDSIIRGMSNVAKKYGALNMSQGYPEFDPPKEILENMQKMAHEDCHQYPISYGTTNIREALVKKYKRFSGMDVNPDEEVVVACGGTEAMVAVMLAITNPGDKVAIFEPVYENYKTNLILTGTEGIYIKLTPPAFTFNPEDVENTFKQGAKILLICNPSNPCGKVFTIEEMTILADLAKKYDAYVVVDEVYEHIVYRPNKMIYMATLPDMRERTIICSSMSKTYSITGWRIGYSIAPKWITDNIKKVHNFLTISAAAPLQEAIVAGLNFGQEYYDDLLDLYTSKRDLMLRGLDRIGINHNVPEGTYFIMLDLRDIMQKSGIEDEIKFAEALCEKAGIAVVPCRDFFTSHVSGYFRMHFAKNDDTINNALERLERAKKVF